MENQNRPHDMYSHNNGERRQSVLPNISSRLHYSSNVLNDPTNARQPTPVSSNYAAAGAITHAAYDPVHDSYDLPRISPTSAVQQSSNYPPEGYPRAERNDPYNYSAIGRFDNPATLPPIKNPHQHEHPPHPNAHELEALSYSSTVLPQPAGHGLHPYRMQTPTYPGGSSSSGLHTMAQRIGDPPASYATLPPLAIPTERPSSSDGKGSAKRIVMACHQCRGRKIRCDAVRPVCSNCVRRHEDCQYDAKPKRRGPDKIPGSRMRSCKSRKQAMGEESPSSPPGGFRSDSSSGFFPSPS
ncbi:hypothetical protein M0805_003167 [Coniferiporia weirii]|nr:hypothetical protein M0805_003167 [Coniferiporia weirii]